VATWSKVRGRVPPGPKERYVKSVNLSGKRSFSFVYLFIGGRYRSDIPIFVASPFSGRGVYHYPDGRIYSGQYNDDRPNGRGKQTDPDGAVLYDGQWRMGEFIG
jgi:hypothetical protein